MIKVGSDFSGVGAFRQALMQLDIKHKTVFACDMDKYARQTYIANYGEPGYYPENVYNRDIPKQSLDIYMTSPPCQAFSLAGKRKGEADKRGILFYNSHEFIQKNKPRYFIFENVKGLLSDDKKSKKDDLGQTFTKWLTLLGGKSVNGNPIFFPHEDSVPYHIYWKVLNAKDYKVPQNRERVFIVDLRYEIEIMSTIGAVDTFKWPKPYFLDKRLKDVLEAEVDNKYFLSDTMLESLSYNGKSKGVIADLNKGGERGAVYSENSDIMSCLSATDYKQPKQVQVKSATKKGFEVAQEGDSINLSHPNSQTRRGRVGKEVAQTLDTACNQGVYVSKEVRTSEVKMKRKLTGTNDFRGKEIEFRESEVMNCITSSLTNDHFIKEKWIKGGLQKNQPEQKDGVSPCLTSAMGMGGGHTPIHNYDYKIRRLTPRECFRLMGFPDCFKMPCSDSQMYKQAGNSIVVDVLAEIISKLKL